MNGYFRFIPRPFELGFVRMCCYLDNDTTTTLKSYYSLNLHIWSYNRGYLLFLFSSRFASIIATFSPAVIIQRGHDVTATLTPVSLHRLFRGHLLLLQRPEQSELPT
jgi:hypothetical protein